MSKRGSGSTTAESILWYGKCPAEFDWNVTKIKPFQYERRHYRE